jgi:hypothetical protein
MGDHYAQLSQHRWLVQEVLAVLTKDTLDARAAEQLGPAFIGILVHSLNQGSFNLAGEIVSATMRAVAKAPTFGEPHETLVFDVGFHIHYVGEENRPAPRMTQPQAPLADVRERFLAELTPLRRSILAKGDPSSVTWFAWLLQCLGEVSIGPMFIVANVYDVLEDAYPAGILEAKAVEALACAIRSARHDFEGNATDEEKNGHADDLAAHLALYVVALKKDDQLIRILGNAGYHPGKKLPQRLASDNMTEETYATVARLLGYKSWPLREWLREADVGSLLGREARSRL